MISEIRVKELKMSSGAVAFMIEHPELVDELGKEELGLLLELVRAERMKLSGCMPPSAVQSLVDAVGDQQVRDIVHDLRTVSEPGGFLPSKSGPSSGTAVRKERSSGWQNPPELEVPPGLKYVDQMIDVQDALDRRDLEKRLR
jgi:hypothetical protein